VAANDAFDANSCQLVSIDENKDNLEEMAELAR
jgi:hypothetical protein